MSLPFFVRACKYDKAIADLDEAIRLELQAVLAYANRALARGMQGVWDKAMADYQWADHLDHRVGL